MLPIQIGVTDSTGTLAAEQCNEEPDWGSYADSRAEFQVFRYNF